MLPIRSGGRSYNHQLGAHLVGFPLLGTRSSTNNKVGESCNALQHPQSLATNLETFHFPETVQVLSNPTPITQSNINLQQKRTKLRHLTRDKTEGKLQNPWRNKKRYCTHLPPSFPWSTPETKRWNLRFVQCSYLVQLNRELKEETISWVGKAIMCD